MWYYWISFNKIKKKWRNFLTFHIDLFLMYVYGNTTDIENENCFLQIPFVNKFILQLKISFSLSLLFFFLLFTIVDDVMESSEWNLIPFSFRLFLFSSSSFYSFNDSWFSMRFICVYLCIFNWDIHLLQGFHVPFYSSSFFLEKCMCRDVYIPNVYS